MVPRIALYGVMVALTMALINEDLPDEVRPMKATYGSKHSRGNKDLWCESGVRYVR